MPSLTPIQNAALNIMDFLYIRDVESLSSFNDAKNNFYSDLLSVIDRINSVRNFTEKRAELYKHYLLCLVETSINFQCKSKKIFSQNLWDKTQFIMDEVIFRALRDGFMEDDLSNDFDGIVSEYKSVLVNEELSFKLVSQSFYFDYHNSSIIVYKKFLELGILETSKYKPIYSKINSQDVDKIFFRAMLIVEFETIKNKFDLESEFKGKTIRINFDDSIEKIEEKFLKIRVIKKALMKSFEESIEVVIINDINKNNIKEVEKYVVNLSDSLGRIPLFLKNIPDCIGYIGCWFSIFFKETNLKIPMFYLYYNNLLEKSDTKKPADDRAREVVLTFGFKIKPRTLHLYYNDFYKYYDSIMKSMKMLERKYF